MRRVLRIVQVLVALQAAAELGADWALMLDTKSTFDSLVSTLAPTPERLPRRPGMAKKRPLGSR